MTQLVLTSRTFDLMLLITSASRIAITNIILYILSTVLTPQQFQTTDRFELTLKRLIGFDKIIGLISGFDL